MSTIGNVTVTKHHPSLNACAEENSVYVISFFLLNRMTEFSTNIFRQKSSFFVFSVETGT